MAMTQYLGACLIIFATDAADGVAGDLADFAKQAAKIEAVLHEQADAWNRGDIEAFMEHYWKSDSLTFNSGGKTTRGWQATKQ